MGKEAGLTEGFEYRPSGQDSVVECLGDVQAFVSFVAAAGKPMVAASATVIMTGL